MLIDPRAVMQELQLPHSYPGKEWDVRPSVQFEQKAEYMLPELLRHSGGDFVDVAYQAILKRLPDDGGRRAYLAALENGRLSKIELLAELRSSAEGLNAGVNVHGLRLRNRLYRLGRLRLIGRPLRWLLAIARMDGIERRLEELEARLASRDDRSERIAAQSLAELREELRSQLANSLHALRKSIGRSEGDAARRLDELTDHLSEIDARFESRIALATDELQQKLSTGSGPVGASEDDLAGIYVRLEQRFRGSEEEIKRRGEIYLPYVADAVALTGSRRVLDLGCGRGELLTLFKEHGYEARGVDLNPIFVAENQKAGHDVVQIDAIAALERCEPASLAVITSLHLVEHLPMDVLVRLLDLAKIALCPGGKLVLETPNPQNLRTSVYYFYYDPTHRNPLPPPLLVWMAEDRGFVEVKVDMLEDGRFFPETVRVPHDAVGADPINRFVDWLSVSPDYAIIASRPR